MGEKQKNFRKSGLLWVLISDLILWTLLMLFKGTWEMPLALLGFGKLFMDLSLILFIQRKTLGSPLMTSMIMVLTSLALTLQTRLSEPQGLKFFIHFLIGITIYATIAYFARTIRSVEKYKWYAYVSMIVLFIVTLIFGKNINGAKNWIILAGVSIQASELIKILFALFIAAYVGTKEKSKSPYFTWLLMGLVFLLLGFFVLQRELGTALVIFMVYIGTLFIFEQNPLHLVFPITLAGFGALGATFVMPHLMVRVEAWINPWKDMSGKGYQITQSLFAMGSGGLFGTGLGKGYPRYIPNVSTDFIYAAIYEEFGFLVASGVLMLFFMFLYMAFQMAIHLKDKSLKVLACALGMIYASQSLVIIGGVTKLIPLTGITLPFMSYGGSSMISSFIGFGILQALSCVAQKEADYV